LINSGNPHALEEVLDITVLLTMFHLVDQWFENGAVFVGIKNPYKRIDTKPISSHVVVKVDGEEVAETNAAVILNETGLKDAYYLPATSIKDWGSIDKSDWRTACPYKGESWLVIPV
jgi:uncharacterized protein (DUF427 family)